MHLASLGVEGAVLRFEVSFGVRASGFYDVSYPGLLSNPAFSEPAAGLY